MLSTYSYPTTSSNLPHDVHRLWKELLGTLRSIMVFDDSDDEKAATSRVLDLSLESSLSDTKIVLSSPRPATMLCRRRNRTTMRSENLLSCKEEEENDYGPVDQQNQHQQEKTLMVPPFSPTYCRPNHFPYSNFYIKLPDGHWLIRFRDGNRSILGTDVIHGNMI